MTIQERIFQVLKPKVASLGFSKKELESVAASIANNLNLDENAEEEEVTAKIEESVGTIIPFLQIGQSQANRLLDAYKQQHPEPKPKPNPEPEPKPTDETPQWAKDIQTAFANLTAEVSGLKAQKTTDTRKAQLEALVKDKGVFGTQALKTFARMSFTDDADFDAYLEGVKEDLKVYEKERSDAGLASLGGHPTPQQKPNTQKLTESQIDAIVANL